MLSGQGLVFAVEHGEFPQVVEILLRAGADPNVPLGVYDWTLWRDHTLLEYARAQVENYQRRAGAMGGLDEDDQRRADDARRVLGLLQDALRAA